MIKTLTVRKKTLKS